MMRILKIVAVVFILYAIITNPSGSAEVARTIWNLIIAGLTGIFSFFHALIH